ncbi:MAG: radical SAM protein [Myxococcales bacterium]|nr:radical SAM protein [Myxococcales bacterium]
MSTADGTRRYLVKEIFGPTLQGEGAHAGRPCVFLRFAVCNLACSWCDTDFRPDGATRLGVDEVVAELLARDRHGSRMVVVTGGEPTLQWDGALATALAAAGFRVHLETNGTRALAAPVDWLTVSPKPRFHEAGDALLLVSGDECKLVVDETIGEADLARYEAMAFGALFVQPCAGPDAAVQLARAIDLVTRRPRWRLSLQLHKQLGLP